MDKQTAGGAPVYACQATEMPAATTRLSVWELRQYVEDFGSGNASLGQIASVLLFLVYDSIASAGIGLGSFMRWSYEAVQRLGSGSTLPEPPGKAAEERAHADLQPRRAARRTVTVKHTRTCSKR